MHNTFPKLTKNEMVKKHSPISVYLDIVLDENQRLRNQLQQVTCKQHQEMCRAIQLKENNTKLQTKIYEAKSELNRLKDLNYRLRNTKFYRNAA